MYSDVVVNVPGIREAAGRLENAAGPLTWSGYQSGRIQLATFSPVSGLDMAGRTHATIAGSYEPVSTKALASHMLDAAALLKSNLDNTVRADFDFSKVVSHIGVAEAVGLAAPARALQAPLAAPALVNAKTGRFANAAPVAGPQFSLPALNSMFSATNPAQAGAAAAQWSTTASTITEAVTALEAAKVSLGTSATTSWVRAALDRINRIQWAGGTYAAHAGAMAAHTTNLATVAAANQVATAVAHGTWLALPSPDQKVLFEQAYLAPFAASLTTGLVPTNPLFNQLLPPLSDMPGDRYDPGGVSAPTVAEFDKTPLPRVVADALAQRGFHDLANASTPAEMLDQFDAVNPDTLEALSAGATPTQAAAVTAPHMPPSLAPGAGMAPGGAAFLGTSGAASPVMGAVPAGGGAPLSSHAAGGTRSAPVAENAFVGGVPGGAAAGARPGVGRAPGVLGATPLGVGGTSGGAGRGALAPSGPGMGSASSSTSQRVVPLGGPAAGHGSRRPSRDRTAARVKAVTSAVEREGNLRALLGQSPAVLPQVIGYNVTQPRPAS